MGERWVYLLGLDDDTVTSVSLLKLKQTPGQLSIIDFCPSSQVARIEQNAQKTSTLLLLANRLSLIERPKRCPHIHPHTCIKCPTNSIHWGSLLAAAGIDDNVPMRIMMPY